MAASPLIEGGDRLVRVVEGHAKICTVLEDWALQQRRAAEAQHAQLKEHERLAAALLAAHREALSELQQLTGGNVGSSVVGRRSKTLPSVSPDLDRSADEFEDLDPSTGGVALPEDVHGIPEDVPKMEAVEVLVPGVETPDAEAGPPDLEEDLSAQFDAMGNDDQMMDWWRRTSGLQTVDKWVSNYRKHPAGWGALLMIHGIPEVTGRLRSKVENYAIYSALFLSMSLPMLTSPPSSITALEDAEMWSMDWWNGPVLARVYFYGFGVGSASHMLSILLGMAFVNALNETARDSDVYRMFARGKGFIATVKCQNSFRVGCVADCVAVAAAMYSYLTIWEVLAGGVLVCCVLFRIVKTTKDLLFKSGSIVAYWREELGGKPDKDDPYDLQIPVGCFKERVRLNGGVLMQNKVIRGSPEEPAAGDALGGGAEALTPEARWREWRAAASESGGGHDSAAPRRSDKHVHPGHGHGEAHQRPVHSAAVAALF